MTKMRSLLAKKEMTVQRMSIEMTGGRTPKYMNMGPREFVPYPYDEFTIKNIQASCIAHYSFLDPIVTNYGCSVEASYEGPVCSNVDQIPDPSKILVRFIPKQNEIVKVQLSPSGLREKLQLTNQCHYYHHHQLRNHCHCLR